ncbi:MAG: hypothetical protein LBT48_06200 [Prevotellaceae bacterium]|jgi:hypothetical protein|nr:hypothetical protein [Prevotellaceae bacterium]
MKKVVTTLTALSLGLSLVFTGCSKDDESEKLDSNNYAGIIAGTYVGSLSLEDRTKIVPSATIIVTRVSDDKITLAMNETLVGFLAGNDLPLDVSCEVEVYKDKYDENRYKFTGNTTALIPQLGGEIPVGFEGSITASGSVDISFAVYIEDMVFLVQFDGTKQ